MVVLALHTWTLDSTPLQRVLEVARRTGWDAIELRRVDFDRAQVAGQAADDVLDQIRASGLTVACVGVELGWMFARGAEQRRLFATVAEQCARAAALGCQMVMSPADPTAGDIRWAAASVRAVGEIAEAHGVRVAIEPPSQAEQLNTLDRVRYLLAAADHPRCGLLLDSYHLERRGGVRVIDDVAPEQIFYVQYSDVPIGPIDLQMTLDRLPPGRGRIAFGEVFRSLAAKGYDGPISYEAPNPTAWARDPEDVAREARDATLACMP